MRGSVIKKGTCWYVKIELDPDPATGARNQKWHSGYRTKREAERARIDLLAKLDRGEYVSPTSNTVAEFLLEWLTAIQPTVRPSTFDSYRRNMHNHVIAHIGATRLTRVDGGVLNGLYAKLLQSGRRASSRKGAGYPTEVVARARQLRAEKLTLAQTAERLRGEFVEAAHITKDTLASLLRRAAAPATPSRARPGLDPRTVAYVHTIVHRAFKDAVRWGRLARNPADAADPPRVDQHSGGVHAWDAATLRRFLDVCRTEEDRLYPLWALLATTGLRRGEALGLRWVDLDLDAGRIRVVQTIIQVGGKVAPGDPKTARGRRSVKLDKATVALLRTHRHRMNQERLRVGPDFHDQDLVFHRPDGSCLHPDSTSATFVRRVAGLGLPRITIHGLRHTWATLALEQGVHPRVVQERLGHSTIAITLGIYSHVSPTLHDEAAQAVADLMLPPAMEGT